MSKKLIIGLLLAGVLVFVLFMMPASLMGSLLERATSQKLTISDTEGTFWSGSGFVSVMDKDGQVYALTAEPVAWSIDKLPLIWGEVSGKLAFTDQRDVSSASQPSRFHFSFREGQIDRLLVPIHLKPLLKLNKVLEGLRLGGTLMADIRQLAWQDGKITVDAVIHWQNVRSGLTSVGTIGTYDFSFVAKQAKFITIHLATIDGPLLLSAEGKMSGTGFLLQGTARAEEQYLLDLQNMLMVLGVERDGVRYFRFAAGSV